MRPGKRALVTLSCALGVTTSPFATNASEQVATGARAIGLGGAFSAIADDASAMYWNPAGLSLIGHQEIALHHTDLYGTNIKENFAAFVLPLSSNLAVGVDWYHSGYEDPELDFSENRFDVAVGMKISSWVSVGVTGKLVIQSIGLDGVSVRDGNGLGLDVGVLATPWRRFRAAVFVQDLPDTKISYPEGEGSTFLYPANLRIGAAFAPFNHAQIACDLDDRIHVGAEYQPVSQFALRAGVQKDLATDEGPILDLGGSFSLGFLRLDYAYESHPVLESTSHFGATMAFSFNPSQVKFEHVDTKPLYASLYKSYSGRDFGSVVVRNLQDKPIQATLHVLVPGYMEKASEQEIILRPKAAVELPLTAVFTDLALEKRGDQTVQVQLSITYESSRLPRTERRSVRTISYGAGAINWAEGTDQAAAFVTTQDPVVAGFAREASHPAAVRPTLLSGNRNLAFTASVFSALEDVGVAYVPDPNNPFQSVAESEHAVDTIHYPRETLSRRAGDCDDTTVLLAALLGNVGINTRFVDAPGHVFLLVDSGVHERNAKALGLPTQLFVAIDEELWFPVETTSLGKGFAAAWRTGADEYQTWSGRDLVQTVDVTAAQARYEPAIPAGKAETPRQASAEGTETRFLAEVAAIEGWRTTYLADQAKEAGPNPTISVAALLELAQVYFMANDLTRTLQKLEEARTTEPGSPAVMNDLAVVYAVRGDVGPAREAFKKARELDPRDPGIALNQGAFELLLGDGTAARVALEQGLKLAGGLAQAGEILGLEPIKDAPDPVRALEASIGSLLGSEERTGMAKQGQALASHFYWKPS